MDKVANDGHWPLIIVVSKCSCCSISAAFDTVDHCIIRVRIENIAGGIGSFLAQVLCD